MKRSKFTRTQKIQTTIKFYCGLETIAATEQFGKLIRQQIEFDVSPTCDVSSMATSDNNIAPAKLQAPPLPFESCAGSRSQSLACGLPARCTAKARRGSQPSHAGSRAKSTSGITATFLRSLIAMGCSDETHQLRLT